MQNLFSHANTSLPYQRWCHHPTSRWMLGACKGLTESPVSPLDFLGGILAWEALLNPKPSTRQRRSFPAFSRSLNQADPGRRVSGLGYPKGTMILKIRTGAKWPQKDSGVHHTTIYSRYRSTVERILLLFLARLLLLQLLLFIITCCIIKHSGFDTATQETHQVVSYIQPN